MISPLYSKVPLATETDIVIASLRCTANLQYFNHSDLVSFCASLTAYSGGAPAIWLRSLQFSFPPFNVHQNCPARK